MKTLSILFLLACVSANAGSATLFWDAPIIGPWQDPPRVMPAFYKAYYQKSGWSYVKYVQTTQTQVTIEGLKRRATYTFFVTGVADVRESARSNMVTIKIR